MQVCAVAFYPWASSAISERFSGMILNREFDAGVSVGFTQVLADLTVDFLKSLIS